MRKVHYSLWGANLMYFIFALMLIFIGGRVQSWDFEYGMIITEYGLVLGPVILLGLLTKVDFKKALKLNKLKGLHIFIIFWIMVFSMPITMTLNLSVITILSFFDKVIIAPIPVATNLKEFAVLFFIVSISAGICEEAFFRGMILNAYEAHFTKKKAIIISAIFFGVFHFNIQNLFGPIFLGLLFGYLVIETKSIFAGVFAHMVNNGIAVTMSFFFTFIQSLSSAKIVQQPDPTEIFNNPVMIIGVLIFCALGSGISAVIIYFLLKWLNKDIKKDEELNKGIEINIENTEEVESLIIEEKSLVPWYKQYHYIPVLGTGVLYLYYLSRHMQV